MGDIVRVDENGHNGHDSIWLRQSVTFSVDGQTRTLEVGIPLPSGATPDEVDALLNEADAGMARLSRYLDERVAAQLGVPASRLSAPVAQASHAEPHPALEGSPAPELQPAEPEPEVDPPASSIASVSPAHEPVVDEPEPVHTPTPAPEPVVVPPSAPARLRPTRSEPQPARAASQPATPANAAPTPTSAPAASPISGPDMTRPQFITALGELGLNPKQAMDRLSVRSLEGLNLREALEALRRQMLQESPASAVVEPEPEPVVETRQAEPEPVAQATPPRYFDEEEDPDLVFTVDEPGFEDEDEFASGESAADQLDEEDELDLEDVPDFPAPPLSAPPVTTSQAPRKAASARTPDVAATRAPATAPTPSSPDRARAMQLVGKLRSAQGGGSASDYQRKAYHNLVEGQLDAEQATALVRGLWRIPPARLTSDQFDALIRWGKEDAFVEEAELVLATLRDEQKRAAADANGASDEQTPSSTPPRSRPVRGASAASAGQGGAR